MDYTPFVFLPVSIAWFRGVPRAKRNAIIYSNLISAIAYQFLFAGNGGNNIVSAAIERSRYRGGGGGRGV
jgi:hypothetical protein